VRQEKKGDIGRAQPVNKLIRAGNQLMATVDDAVHVDQITNHAFPSALGAVGSSKMCLLDPGRGAVMTAKRANHVPVRALHRNQTTKILPQQGVIPGALEWRVDGGMAAAA